MFLSNFSVKKPIATLVLIIGMMCMGLLALNHLRVNQNPDVEIPIIVVTIPYPGASPETSERELIDRLEKQMLAITGVTEVGRIRHDDTRPWPAAARPPKRRKSVRRPNPTWGTGGASRRIPRAGPARFPRR